MMVTLESVKARTDMPPRVRNKLFEASDGCWQWSGKPVKAGYIQINFRPHGKKPYLHRYIYQSVAGAIPLDLVLDHKCRNRLCCNPNHLRVVTRFENTMENSLSLGAVYKARSACSKGHEYTAENTITTTPGVRLCRTCKIEKQARYRAKLRSTTK